MFALAALATASSAQAATYLQLGTSNASNATTTLTGTTAGAELLVKNADGSSASAFSLYGLLTATAPTANAAAVRGYNSATNAHGYGVWGSQAGSGTGVYGSSPSGKGVWGASTSGIGVRGQSTSGTGVYGIHTGSSGNAAGVHGQSTNWNGVEGFATGFGVSAVYGQNWAGYGIAGRANNANFAGALGENLGSGPGVVGRTTSSNRESAGVVGISSEANGVLGTSSEAFNAGTAGRNNVVTYALGVRRFI